VSTVGDKDGVIERTGLLTRVPTGWKKAEVSVICATRQNIANTLSPAKNLISGYRTATSYCLGDFVKARSDILNM
jgi:hypothetical protein